MADFCPYCNNDIHNKLWVYFWDSISYEGSETEFDYTCPECEQVIEIDVVPVPEFNLHKKDEFSTPLP